MKTLGVKREIRAAFTIVELLTVMSIIVILIGILVPSINTVKKHARNVEQKAQFHSIDVAMEMFNAAYEGYPPSSYDVVSGKANGGAMKLCEAMVGQDLQGFHPESDFTVDVEDRNGDLCYKLRDSDPQLSDDNRRSRYDQFLPLEQANAYRMSDIYDTAVGSFEKDSFVLCDVFAKAENKGGIGAKRIGLPILYFRADTSKSDHDLKTVGSATSDNIYDYTDNDELVQLGIPWSSQVTPDQEHPMSSKFPTLPKYSFSGHLATLSSSAARFYIETMNEKVSMAKGQPYRSDSYILMSAGNDGLFGTADDIFNFGN